MLTAGAKDVTLCDRKGAIYAGRDGLNWIKEEMAQVPQSGRGRAAGGHIIFMEKCAHCGLRRQEGGLSDSIFGK